MYATTGVNHRRLGKFKAVAEFFEGFGPFGLVFVGFGYTAVDVKPERLEVSSVVLGASGVLFVFCTGEINVVLVEQ